jgi:two-component system, OmpR family, alkaline phosphatase synthesis response regulator PhoP
MRQPRSEKPRILILDDDEDIVELLYYNFSKEGYQVQFQFDTTDAIQTLKEFKPHLVILDVMIAPTDGLDLCGMIRQQKSFENTHIFILSAKPAQRYQSLAFQKGGDEFVEKIIGLKPLLSKVHMVLKEGYVIQKRQLEVTLDKIELFRETCSATVNGDVAILNKNEFEILFFLMQNNTKRIPVKSLIKGLWGSSTFMDEKSVLISIDCLKKKLGERIILEPNQNTFTLSKS